MKKSIVVLCIFCLSFLTIPATQSLAQSGDPEFDGALQRMYENGLTRYSNAQDFRPADPLTREQAAKFFVEFTKVYFSGRDLANEYGEASNCFEFEDLVQVDTTLLESVLNSCHRGLFKGSNNYFSPQSALTKAAGITVLVRSLDEKFLDESTSPWWDAYFNRARQLSLTKESNVWNLDKPITRYEIALLLYRAVHGGQDPDLIDLKELEKLLLELGLLTS